MFKNLKTSTKILTLIALVSLIGFALAGFSALQMTQIDRVYTKLVAEDSPAIIKLVRAGRNMSEAAYSAYRVVDNPGDSDTAKAAKENFDHQVEKTVNYYYKEIEKVFPEQASAIDALEKIMHQAEADGREAIRLGTQDRNAEAKPFLTRMDESMAAYIEGYSALRDVLLSQVARQSNATTAETWSTIYAMFCASLVLLLAAARGDPRGIEDDRPTHRATDEPHGPTGPRRPRRPDRRRRAARRDRRDGAGAGGVPGAAIEKIRLATEADEARRAQASSRERQAAIDSAKAEDLRAFVVQVEGGFTRLAAGDLTARMSQPVAPEFEPIRAQFNQAVSQLRTRSGRSSAPSARCAQGCPRSRWRRATSPSAPSSKRRAWRRPWRRSAR